MSTLVSDLITRALVGISDREGRRTSRADMLVFFNEVQDEIATDCRALQTDYYFNVVKDEPRYAYPEDGIQISGIRYAKTTSPQSLADYYSLDEKFNDEWRRATFGFRPSAWVYGYCARPGWFELLNAPAADIVDGGIVTTWRIADQIALESAGAMMELPDWLRTFVVSGMKIKARMVGRERDVAAVDYAAWQERFASIREKIEDRSDDRRPAIRPPGAENPFLGMR